MLDNQLRTQFIRFHLWIPHLDYDGRPQCGPNALSLRHKQQQLLSSENIIIIRVSCPSRIMSGLVAGISRCFLLSPFPQEKLERNSVQVGGSPVAQQESLGWRIITTVKGESRAGETHQQSVWRQSGAHSRHPLHSLSSAGFLVQEFGPFVCFPTDAGWGRVATGLHCTGHSQASVLGWSSLPRPTGG